MLGNEHPKTHNLAATLHEQGNLAGARNLQEALLAVSRRTLGEEHPKTLTVMHNLAETVAAQGDLAGARALQVTIVAVRRRTLATSTLTHSRSRTTSPRRCGTQLARIYELARLHVNFFQPVQKLVRKTRDGGARVHRLYDRAQRLSATGILVAATHRKLAALYRDSIRSDFRRKAVRNLERAGGHAVGGHEDGRPQGRGDLPIYRRYAIADESMLREGAAKLEALFQAQQGATPVVVPMRTGKVLTESAPGEGHLQEMSAAQLAEMMRKEVVGRGGIEPPTPGFSSQLKTCSHLPSRAAAEDSWRRHDEH